MITIMLISSITFAFRAIIECLFLFDVIVLDFECVVWSHHEVVKRRMETCTLLVRTCMPRTLDGF